VAVFVGHGSHGRSLAAFHAGHPIHEVSAVRSFNAPRRASPELQVLREVGLAGDCDARQLRHRQITYITEVGARKVRSREVRGCNVSSPETGVRQICACEAINKAVVRFRSQVHPGKTGPAKIRIYGQERSGRMEVRERMPCSFPWLTSAVWEPSDVSSPNAFS
jgi:hypothetical protein